MKEQAGGAKVVASAAIVCRLYSVPIRIYPKARPKSDDTIMKPVCHWYSLVCGSAVSVRLQLRMDRLD